MRAKPAFDLRSLEIFLAVAETRNMTAAARRLGLTQSAVSQAIKHLEEKAGVALVDRALRPLGLTAAGLVLGEHARDIVVSANQLPQLLRQSHNARLPQIRIGLVDSFAASYGAQLIQALRPVAAHIRVWSGLSGFHAEALLNRNLDVIVNSDAVEDAENLERHALLREPFVLVLPSVHQAEVARVADLAELAQQLSFVRYSARSYFGSRIERQLRRMRIDPPRNLEFDSSDVVIGMVGANLGWTIASPLCLMQARGHWDKVRVLPLPGPGFSRRLTVVAHKGEFGHLPEHVARVARDILEAQFVPALRGFLPWLGDGLRVG
ncbi:MAG: LysR family transcriptional regulator [Proteobacteria bacterium]|nr:LysR family transcriptional regulator [Pseudomonadota bacterium]